MQVFIVFTLSQLFVNTNGDSPKIFPNLFIFSISDVFIHRSI